MISSLIPPTQHGNPLKTSQRGIAMVELTIVTPLMLFLLLAVAELGYGFMQYNTLTRAVRDGARYAASNAFLGTTQIVDVDAALRAETENVIRTGTINGISTAQLQDIDSITVTLEDDGDGNITVIATYQYQTLIGSLLPAMIGTGDIDTAFTMRAQLTMGAIG